MRAAYRPGDPEPWLGSFRRRSRSGGNDTAEDAQAPRSSGRLKVYLGFAAGVGKTYTMLEDAQAARQAGVDVVIGYVEPHARPATTALMAGLEVVPPLEISRGGATLRELDLDAILARQARVVLVDELAHTNAPGCRHAKRYEDVRTILESGADVWTTVNIQHLASLNDHVAAITHVRQRETIPDAVLAEADEVVTIDLPPEELRERIAQGRVYPRERIAAALDGFFRPDRLAALRELALREVAHVVEGRRVGQVGGADSPLAPNVESVADRLLILAAGRSGDDRVLRRGWRLARRLQCDVEVLHVVVEGVREAAERLRELRELCIFLSLPLEVLSASGHQAIGSVVAEHARKRRVTHVLAGAARDRRLPWRGSTLQAIMDALPWVDFIVIGDPARRHPEAEP